MGLWAVALVTGALVALVQYGFLERAPFARSAAPALLRASAVALLVAVLLDAPAGRRDPGAALVALDVSESMQRPGSVWTAAMDSARRIAAGAPILLFGDTLRQLQLPAAPADRRSLLTPVADRAVASGRPVTVISDGEIADPDAVTGLPAGSRLIVLEREHLPDAAVDDLEAPPAARSGDSITVRATIVASGAGAGAGFVAIVGTGRELARQPMEPLPPYGSRTVALNPVVPATAGPIVLSVLLSSDGDAIALNDTAHIVIDVTRSAAAVLVSTSPDQDSRHLTAVLRGTVSVPTRAYFQVAPGQWRRDGDLAAVPVAEVRAAMREAPLLVLHGDTAAFGAPMAIASGSLLLFHTAGDQSGEWYPMSAPPSPVSTRLAGVRWEVLPPLAAGPPVPGAAVALEAARGRGRDRRPVIVLRETPRRVAVVTASGFWRWAFRRGEAGEAYTTLWGSILDWLMEERGGALVAAPAGGVQRAGDPVVWRRGATSDSVVSLVIAPRDDTARTDTVVLSFLPGDRLAYSPALDPGIYVVRPLAGTQSASPAEARNLLAVSQSAEWQPRRPSLRSMEVTGGAVRRDRRGARTSPWIFVLSVLLLGSEWVLRRRLGLR